MTRLVLYEMRFNLFMEKRQLELLWDSKRADFCEHMLFVSERFDRLLSKSILKELSPFLAACPDFLFDTYNLKSLRRLFFSHCRCSKQAEVHIFPITPYSWGLSIALPLLGEHEFFSEKHMLKAAQNLISGIKSEPRSYFCRQREKKLLFYLEIKKVRGGSFTAQERKKLALALPQEVQQAVERVSQSLFLPGNEEELFKNIRHLSTEIRSEKDLPQVMISFNEYRNGTLKFLVIAVRVAKSSSSSLFSQSHLLPALVRFSLENLFCVGKLRKKHPKEAAIFTLEVNSSLFLKNNHSVNLRAARQYIAKSLESMLGAFRDYNGGFLIQENKQLFQIKQYLDKKGIQFDRLEDFFYEIKPISLRTTFSSHIGIQFVEMIQNSAAIPLRQGHTYRLESRIVKNTHLAVIKTMDKKWKTLLPKQILAKSSHIGCSYFEEDGFLYLCFFHQSPTSPILFNALKEALQADPSTFSQNQSALLRINFQGGEPSSLNPRFAADIHSHILTNFLFEGLVRFTRSGDVEPALADSIFLSPSRTLYTFSLRSACWSNGEEISSYHFEKTWKKALMANSAACMKPDFFFFIKNAKAAKEGKVNISEVGIFAADAKTLVIELESPCPYFLNLLATPSFFPLYGDEEEPTVFNGPFVLADAKPDSYLLLSQNPFYRNAHEVKLSGIHISLVKDPQVAYEMFLKGDLDLIGDPTSPLPPKLLNWLKIQKNLVCKDISRVFWIHCNTHTFPLNNDHLRRALSLCLDRKKIVDKVFIEQIPHASPLPQRYARCQESVEGDVAKARIYFQMALDELNMRVEDFPPLIMTHSNLSFEQPLIEELKRQWKEALGIDLIPRPLPWMEFSSSLERGDFQLGGLFRRDLFNHPLFFLNFFKKSTGNSHSWDNAEYEKLLEKLAGNLETPVETNKKVHNFDSDAADGASFPNQPVFSTSEPIVEDLERLLIEKAPVIPLVNQRYLVLIQDRVEGFSWNRDGCFDLTKVRIHEMDPPHTDPVCRHSDNSMSVG